MQSRHGPLALLQFDAHGDTWESAGPLDHGTMFRRAIQEGLIAVERSLRVGIRTQDDADFGLLTLSSAWVHRQGIDAALDATVRIGQAPCYLTFDIDALDPAFAPGTGTPVNQWAGELAGARAYPGLDALTFVGMDLVGPTPAYDSAEITAIAAATLAHDLDCAPRTAEAIRMNIGILQAGHVPDELAPLHGSYAELFERFLGQQGLQSRALQ